MQDRLGRWGQRMEDRVIGYGSLGLGTWARAQSRVQGMGPVVGDRKQGMGTRDTRLETGDRG